MRKLKIEILQGDSGDWYWRIKGSNGKILASSETYSSRRKASNTAMKLMTAKFMLLK
jgi:uncharacterized protein YegP (UPF0339 family)